jgi:serine/threonine protein kinase
MSTEPRYLGKYELQKRLARGGQGEVWKAFDTRLRRYVAIKQLHADLQSDPDFISRFEREARFIASLHHPNIVQIHDFQLGHTSDSDTSVAYMVMDYIEGPTLADYIRNTSRKMQFPAAADIVYIFTAISLAIDYAHERGMIHRDIKPANVMLDQRSPRRNPLGEPILTDFGIAKLQGVAGDATKVLGTPLYVSPEQAQGRAGDKRSDLYSLGIILYEMTTGVTPFRSDSLMVILMQHLNEIPTPPALINPNIPPALSEVILKSIAKDPDARFPSASAMTIAVAEALNVPAPVELSKPPAASDGGSNFYNPLHPSQPPGMTPASLTPPAFQYPTVINTPSPAFIPATNEENDGNNGNDGQIPLATPMREGSGYAPFTHAGTNKPAGAIPHPVQSPSLAAPQRPRRRLKPLQRVLLALLIAIVAGSGLLYAFFALNKTTPPSSNTVVGQVRFLSVSMPNVRPGTIDEVKITIPHIHDAPPGTHYYAWLLVNSDSALIVRWLLTPQNGSLSSSYSNAQLLANQPYRLIITAETTDNGVPSQIPGARFYYASLSSNVQPSAMFDIHTCPGDSNSVCMS